MGGSDNQKNICEFPLSVPVFFCTILLLWTLVIFGDVRSCVRLAFDIHCLSNVEDSGALAVSTDGKHVIIGMRRMPRWCIYFFAVVPKMCVALITWWYGCRWLTSVPDFASLILDSVGLGFIVNVDEILYSAIIPEFVRIQLERTSVYTSRLENSKMDRQWREIYFIGYLTAMLYIVLCVVITYLYIFRFQRVLPAFQWDVTEHCMQHRLRGDDMVAKL